MIDVHHLMPSPHHPTAVPRNGIELRRVDFHE